MKPALIFLIFLLLVVVGLNWRILAARLGWRVSACDWQRVKNLDGPGYRVWFCAACGRSERVEGKEPPPACGRTLGRS